MEKAKINKTAQNIITKLGQKAGSALDIKTNEDFNKQLPVQGGLGLKTVSPVVEVNEENDFNQISGQSMAETISDNIEAVKHYTCSMHPEVISNKPGKCPKCGMELVEKK